jgi:membrane protein DedA with SNARE-associated domain
VFASRLVPLVRNFVALPAGIAEVPALRFGLLTAAGSLVWDGAMALIGYEVGGSFLKVAHRIKDVGYGVGAVVVIGLAYVIWHRWRSYREATAGDQARRSVVGAGLGDEASEAATAPGAAPGRPAD